MSHLRTKGSLVTHRPPPLPPIRTSPRRALARRAAPSSALRGPRAPPRALGGPLPAPAARAQTPPARQRRSRRATRACGGAQRRAGPHLVAQERGGVPLQRACEIPHLRRAPRQRARAAARPPVPVPRRGGAHRLAALRLRAAPVADRKQRAVPAHKSSRARAPSAPAVVRGGVGRADALLEEPRGPGLVKWLRGARAAGRVRGAREHFPERLQLQALAAAGEGRRGVNAPYPPRARRQHPPSGPRGPPCPAPTGLAGGGGGGRAAPSCGASGAQRAAGGTRRVRLVRGQGRGVST
jgi:hypothetical protein